MSIQDIKVPGAVWALLLIAGGALIEANFDENSLYYQMAMGAIVAAIKALEVNADTILKWFGQEEEPERMRTVGRMRTIGPETQQMPAQPTSRLTRWLVG